MIYGLIAAIAFQAGWWAQFWNAARCWPRDKNGKRL